MTTGMVFDIMHFSTRDGPGIRTTVFLKGCPLRCQWCHNPESQSPRRELMFRPNLCISCLTCIETCPNGAITSGINGIITDSLLCQLCGDCIESCYADAREIVGREMTSAEVISEVAKDIPFYDQSGGGITFSGGEPLMQPAFLLELLTACKEMDLPTAVDTSGYATWQVIDRLRGLVDLFLYDLKIIDEDKHRQYTGVSNRLILSNLHKLAELGHRMVVRVPLIPGFNDSNEDLNRLGELVSSLSNIEYLELLPYHESGIEKYHRLGKPYPLTGIIPPLTESVQQCAQLLRSFDVPILIGG